MRKKIYPVILFAALIMAQSDPLWSQFGSKLGPIAVIGIQVPRITGETDTWYPVKFQGGVIVPVVKINGKLSIRFEANLSMQGSKWDDSGQKGKTDVLYINAPLVVRYRDISGFFGEAGIQPGYLLRAKAKVGGETFDSYNDLKKFDIAIPVGIGYEFKNNIGIGLRVIPGLLTVSKTETGTDHNLVIALRGTYTFKEKY
jgi:hypothetical protein